LGTRRKPIERLDSRRDHTASRRGRLESRLDWLVVLRTNRDADHSRWIMGAIASGNLEYAVGTGSTNQTPLAERKK